MASASGTKRMARNERSGPPAKRSTQKSKKKESTSDLKYFFHYTNKKGKDAITKQGFIKASGYQGVDAAFGKGVYLTSLPPLDGKVAVARNNWEQGFYQALEHKKLDYVIMILMPVDGVKHAPTKRDVYLYKGNLVLEEYDYKILTWKKAVKECKDLTLQMLDEESYGDENVDDWISLIFPY